MDTSETMAEASFSRDGYNREYRSSSKSTSEEMWVIGCGLGECQVLDSLF